MSPQTDIGTFGTRTLQAIHGYLTLTRHSVYFRFQHRRREIFSVLTQC